MFVCRFSAFSFLPHLHLLLLRFHVSSNGGGGSGVQILMAIAYNVSRRCHLCIRSTLVLALGIIKAFSNGKRGGIKGSNSNSQLTYFTARSSSISRALIAIHLEKGRKERKVFYDMSIGSQLKKLPTTCSQE